MYDELGLPSSFMTMIAEFTPTSRSVLSQSRPAHPRQSFSATSAVNTGDEKEGVLSIQVLHGAN